MRVIIDTQLVSFGDEFGISFRTRDMSGVIMLIRLFSRTYSRVDHILLKLDETTRELQLETKFGTSERVSYYHLIITIIILKSYIAPRLPLKALSIYKLSER